MHISFHISNSHHSTLSSLLISHLYIYLLPHHSISYSRILYSISNSSRASLLHINSIITLSLTHNILLLLNPQLYPSIVMSPKITYPSIYANSFILILNLIPYIYYLNSDRMYIITHPLLSLKLDSLYSLITPYLLLDHSILCNINLAHLNRHLIFLF